MDSTPDTPAAPTPSRNLFDYIRVYDGALPFKLCSDMILSFEAAANAMQTKHTLIEGFRDFHEIPVNELPGDLTGVLVGHMRRFLNQYQKDAGIHPSDWPTQVGFEKLRMKRYEHAVGEFGRHVDVGDYASARRFLVYFFYLNDVEHGGETVFYDANGEVALKVKPKRGSLLLFPPLWCFPHAGLMPRSGPKYIAGGYLHYT